MSCFHQVVPRGVGRQEEGSRRRAQARSRSSWGDRSGATILGNVMIGAGAKIGAGSVVLIDVPARSTAVGNPVRLLSRRKTGCEKEEDMPGESMDHTSFIRQWSDYTI